jgi:outer membrane receptor protein involved in Fe transport
VPGQAILNLRADWEHFLGNPVTLSAFVNNANNKLYTDGSVTVVGIYGVHYAAPRMFGLQLTYKFGEGFKPKE